jgi:hypothetical protein
MGAQKPGRGLLGLLFGGSGGQSQPEPLLGGGAEARPMLVVAPPPSIRSNLRENARTRKKPGET